MARILVFDSGVGGLSILRSLKLNEDIQQHTHEWLFCSDNAFFPYGLKKEDELIARVSAVLQAICTQYQPDIIILACNTASTVALEAVRKTLTVPIVGVVPAIKPAAQLTESRCIGLLATPGTVARAYTQQLIDDFASDCRVERIGSNELVNVAEQYLRTGMVDQSEIYRAVAPFRAAISQHQLDTIVLACTHFPLIAESLRRQLPEIKYWVDSSDAIARRVASLLTQLPEQSFTKTPITNIALFTRMDATVDSLQRALMYLGLEEMRLLTLQQN
jgi:glutamate racemase